MGIKFRVEKSKLRQLGREYPKLTADIKNALIYL
jgi:hypothetical protein